MGPTVSVDNIFNVVLGKVRGAELLDHKISMVKRCDVYENEVNKSLNNLTQGAAEKAGLHACGALGIFAMSKVVMSMFVRDANCSDLTLALKGYFELDSIQRRNHKLMKSGALHPAVFISSPDDFEEMVKPMASENKKKAKTDSKAEHK